MSHAPPFGCNEYPPGGARPDEEAFVSTEQQSQSTPFSCNEIPRSELNYQWRS